MSLLGLIAILGRNRVENVVSLVGSFCGIPLVFIYPALAHYWATGGSINFSQISNIFIIILGLVLLVCSTVANIMAIIGESKSYIMFSVR